MTAYKAVLFSPDGEGWVTDYRGATVDEVWERAEDGGSRWFFYPFHFVIRDHGPVTTETQRIVDSCDAFPELRGLTLRTVGRVIAANPEYVTAVLTL